MPLNLPRPPKGGRSHDPAAAEWDRFIATLLAELERFGRQEWPAPSFLLSTPSNPTGTTATAGVMAGLAVYFTPRRSGFVEVTIAGSMLNDTNTDGVGVQLRYGTGTAPANGDAPTGSVAGQSQSSFIDTAGNTVGFSIPAALALTAGATYWFDARQNAVTGGTASLANLTVRIIELTA